MRQVATFSRLGCCLEYRVAHDMRKPFYCPERGLILYEPKVR